MTGKHKINQHTVFSLYKLMTRFECGSTYRETVRHKLKNSQKMHFLRFLGCFWAYVGQSHYHIGWGTLMSFTSINPTNPRTGQSLKLSQKTFENRWFWKSQFFWVSHFENNFAKIYFFASFPWKSVNICRIARMGRNFDDYPGFQQIPGMPIILQQSVL